MESLHWVVPYGNDLFMVTSFLATESVLFDSLERPLRPKENSFFSYVRNTRLKKHSEPFHCVNSLKKEKDGLMAFFKKFLLCGIIVTHRCN